MLKVFLAILMLYCSASAQEKDNLLSLKYGKLSVSVDAETGGRIVSLMYDGKEFLTGKDIHPDNYGSTLWPSPQSLWNWPPPAILDAEEYKVESGKNTFTLESSEDKNLGLRFSKSFAIDSTDTSLIITYRMHNISEKNIEAAPWEITRMRKGGVVCFPKGVSEPKAKTFDPVPYTESNGILWYKNNKDEKLKNHLLSVADGSEGWLAYIIDGYLYLKKFDDVPKEAQFGGEGEIAVYVNPVSAYVEIEAQGAKNNLNPGISSEWKMKWIIRKLPQEINGDNEIITFIHKLISK